MKDANVYSDGFTARAIESLDEVHDSIAATGGLVEPSGIAKHYAGISKFDRAFFIYWFKFDYRILFHRT